MNTKKIKFQGAEYVIPDWAAFITVDEAGHIYVFETEPEWSQPCWIQKGTFWRCQFVAKVSNAICEKI